jgi:hypothetical protein
MKLDAIKEIHSSFLSCEKDYETILKKLFIDDKQHAEELKRLLVINMPDCLDNTVSQVYRDKINSMSIAKLRKEGYIRLEPKLKLAEHNEVMSYIFITFDDFTTNSWNPKFRDCVIHIDVICHTDCWDLGNYRLRPVKICGYIDGLLNESRLSGLGTLNFLGCNFLALDENLTGYSLIYRAVHGTDDIIPDND